MIKLIICQDWAVFHDSGRKEIIIFYRRGSSVTFPRLVSTVMKGKQLVAGWYFYYIIMGMMGRYNSVMLMCTEDDNPEKRA